MKRIFNFFKWLFGYGVPDTQKTQELVEQEVVRIEEMQKSVQQIKVIHEEISTKLDACITKKEKVESTPRLKPNEIKKLLLSGKELSTVGLPRKDKQYYARKVFALKTKKNMKIVFSKLTKCYKYYPNGL
jgi:hypothetical protein